LFSLEPDGFVLVGSGVLEPERLVLVGAGVAVSMGGTSALDAATLTMSQVVAP
jgi:hypothetical protein